MATFEVIRAANIGGGGGGGSSLFPLYGTGIASGNVLGDLNGNNLTVRDGSGGGTTIFQLDLTATDKISLLQAYSDEGGGGTFYSKLQLAAGSDIGTNFFLSANDGSNIVSITGDPVANTLAFTAGGMSINGHAGFSGTGSYTTFTIENGLVTAAS